MGGSIQVTSQVRVGSCFTVTIPFSAASPSQPTFPVVQGAKLKVALPDMLKEGTPSLLFIVPTLEDTKNCTDRQYRKNSNEIADITEIRKRFFGDDVGRNKDEAIGAGEDKRGDEEEDDGGAGEKDDAVEKENELFRECLCKQVETWGGKVEIFSITQALSYLERNRTTEGVREKRWTHVWIDADHMPSDEVSAALFSGIKQELNLYSALVISPIHMERMIRFREQGTVDDFLFKPLKPGAMLHNLFVKSNLFCPGELLSPIHHSEPLISLEAEEPQVSCCCCLCECVTYMLCP